MSNPVELYCSDTKVKMPNETTLARIGFGRNGMSLGMTRLRPAATYFPNGYLTLDDRGRQQFAAYETKPEVHCSHILSGTIPFRMGTCAPEVGLYPPPSYLWFHRTRLGGMAHYFFIQPISDNSSAWLTIVDSSYTPVTAHPIKPHELAKLYMRNDAETYAAMRSLASRSIGAATAAVLDMKPPSNKTTYWALTRGLQNIDSLKNAATTRDLVEPLVPESFPPDAREEYMEFLGMLIHRRIPKQDPIDVFSMLSSSRLLFPLYGVQLKYQLEELPTPPYPKILFDAETSANRPSGSAAPANLPAWLIAMERIVDSAPNWTPRALGYLRKAPKRSSLLEFPVTKAMARSSSGLFKDRAALMFDGYNLRTLVDFRRMGLEKLVYTGRAHTWPHRHLEKSLELKFGDGPEKSLQVMVVPRQIVATVEANTPRTTRIDFETSVLNAPVYHTQLNTWTAPFAAMRRPPVLMSLSELQQKAKWSLVADERIPDRDEARALDLTSSNFYVDMLENPRFLREYKIDVQKMEMTLAGLMRKRIIRPIRGIRTHNMPTALVEAHGDEGSVCGLSWALLSGTPRAQVMIGEGGKHSYITCKVPEYQYSNFVDAALRAAEGLGIRVEVADVLSLTSYMNSLYQRILKNDETWDTDLSELLSQISFRKHKGEPAEVDG